MNAATEGRVRLGVVGFGAGGNYFHSPFIQAAPHVELAGVVTRSPARRQELADRYPGVPAYDSLAEMVEAERAGDGLDAVTITTPPDTRHDLVLEALSLGLHVVADKPFAPDAAGARELDAAARAAGLQLAVFHNRRWDSDIQTVQAVLRSGRLGAVSRFCSTFDLDSPETLDAGPAGGLLRDLGSHLVDQALWLFGPAATVFATLEWAGSGDERTDAGFLVTLVHRSGITSVLSASKRSHLTGRNLRLYGSLGGFVMDSTDVQAQAVFAGEWPAADPEGWGFEPRSTWGSLYSADPTSVVPAEQGTYVAFYEAFAEAILHGSPLPVTAAEGVEVLRVLDAARLSAIEGHSVDLSEDS